MVKEYGSPDDDRAAYDLLLQSLDMSKVEYIVHYPRVPYGLPPCRHPGSLTVAAVLFDKTVVKVRQLVPGATPTRI